MKYLDSRIVDYAIASKFGNKDFFDFDPKGQIHVDAELGNIYDEDVFYSFLKDFCYAVLTLPLSVLLWPIRFPALCWLKPSDVDRDLYKARYYAFQSDQRLALAWLGSLCALLRLCLVGNPALHSETLTRTEVCMPFLAFLFFCSVEVIRKQRRTVTFFVNHMRHELCRRHSIPVEVSSQASEDNDFRASTTDYAHRAKNDFQVSVKIDSDILSAMAGLVEKLDEKLNEMCWNHIRFHVGGDSKNFLKYLCGFIELDAEDVSEIETSAIVHAKILEKLRSQVAEKAFPMRSSSGLCDSRLGSTDELLKRQDEHTDEQVKHLIETFDARKKALDYIKSKGAEKDEINAIDVKMSVAVFEMMLCLAYPQHFRPDRSMTSVRNITEVKRDGWHLLLAFGSMVHAAIPRLWMWLQYTPADPKWALWPCDDVLSNMVIYTTVACNFYAHWVTACFLLDAYLRMSDANECLTILQRFVKDAPNFKSLMSYNKIMSRYVAEPVDDHDKRRKNTVWCCTSRSMETLEADECENGHYHEKDLREVDLSGVHKQQAIKLRWTVGKSDTKEFKPLFQFALKDPKEVKLWWELRKSYIIYFSNDKHYLELYMGLLIVVGGGLSLALTAVFFLMGKIWVCSCVLTLWDLVEIAGCMLLFLTVCIKTNDLLSSDSGRLLAIRQKLHEQYDKEGTRTAISLLQTLGEIIDKNTQSVKVFGTIVDQKLRARILSALVTGISFGLGSMSAEDAEGPPRLKA